MRRAPRSWGGPTPISLVFLLLCLSAPGFVHPFSKGGRISPPASIERLLRASTAVQKEVLTAESCPFDPAAAVLRLGLDADKLAEYVAREIAYEPYLGAVRGAEGTLAARAGGDWDRALLLRELLAHAGYQPRLLVLTRSKAECAALATAFLKEALHVRGFPVTASKADRDASPLYSRFGVPEKNGQIHDARSQIRMRGLLDEALDAGLAEARSLEKTLTTAGQTLGQALEAWRAPLLAGAKERVLVEIGQGSSRRVFHLGPDPQPPTSKELRRARRLEQVPANRRGRLQIKLLLLAEKAGKKEKAKELLKRSLPLESLFRLPLRLDIVPVDEKWSKAKPPGQWNQKEWYTALSSFQRFQAVLYVGSEWSGSMVFDLEGKLHSVTKDGRIEAATKMGTGLRRGLGGMFGGDAKKKSDKDKGQIEELRLEFELALPGAAPIRQSRLLYGRLQKQASPVFTADMLAVPGPVLPDSTTWMQLSALTRNIPVLADFLSLKDPTRFRGAQKTVRFPAMLHEWQLARLALARRILTLDPRLAARGGPALLMKVTQLAADKESESVSKRRSIDVVFDSLQLMPAEEKVPAAAMQHCLALGMASTVLESLLLRGQYPGLEIMGAYGSAEGARLLGLTPVTRLASGTSTAKVEPPPLSQWSIARNEPGRVLVFPSQLQPNSWWSVDAAMVTVIGRGGGGEGQAAIEYLEITKMNLDHLKCWMSFQKAVMFGGNSERAGYAWLDCMTGATDPLKHLGYGFKAAGMSASGTWNSALTVLVGVAKLGAKKK